MQEMLFRGILKNADNLPSKLSQKILLSYHVFPSQQLHTTFSQISMMYLCHSSTSKHS